MSSYAVRDIEEYRNFCDRSNDQRPQPHEVLKVIIQSICSISLMKCELHVLSSVMQGIKRRLLGLISILRACWN